MVRLRPDRAAAEVVFTMTLTWRCGDDRSCYALPMNSDRELGVAGNPVMVFRSLVMPSPPRPAGLIQRYRKELQARHYARRTVNTYETAQDGQCGGERLSHAPGG
jgi:hypothetical protein